MINSKDWHVVRTRPAEEGKAAASFKLHKIETYHPVERGFRKTTRGRVEWERPAINGYIFARLDEGDMYKLHGMEGVAYAIPNTAAYRKLEVFVRWLKLVERVGMFDKTLATKRRKIAQGAAVKIAAGPYTGFHATFLRMEGKGRARVMLSVFGRPDETTISLDQLEAA